MKFKSVISGTMAVVSAVLAVACSDDTDFRSPDHEEACPIELSGKIDQEYVSRADDAGFADGDRMGVFIVDYDDSSPGVLAVSGNRANNTMFELKGAHWVSSGTFYWKNSTTPVDVYGYYPYTNVVADVDSHLFEVSADQRVAGDGAMGGYEASDFLWAKATGVTQSGGRIVLNYTHRMAGVMVTLQRGSGISETEWGKVTKSVAVDNVTRFASIDLAAGTVTSTGKPDRQIVMGDQLDDTYRAVVVPQQVSSGTRLISITIDGTSYNYVRDEALTLLSGKLHRFTLKVDKKDGGDYAVTLVSEEITPWENDRLTHNFLEYEYTIVTVSEPGTLKSAIEAMGKDYTQVKNLKIVGPVTTADFNFMREEMTELAMLNMKETKSKDIEWSWWAETSKNHWEDVTVKMDNAIPGGAFYGKKSLRRIIFSDEIERIGREAFRETGLDINSSVILPANLKRIDEAAFGWIGEAGELVLNDKLERIESYAFAASSFRCELNLSQTLTYIGDHAFGYSGNNPYFITATGHFRLSDNLEYIGESAFERVQFDGMGELIIPKYMTEVIPFCPGFTRGTTLTLHDNIRRIGDNSFIGHKFINHINIPEGVTEIGTTAFNEAVFNAGLSMPSTLRKLGYRCFLGARGLGDLMLPEGIEEISGGCFGNSELNSIVLPNTVTSIGAEAFAWSDVKAVTIGKYCDFIGERAFQAPALQTLVCLNPEPPVLDGDPFVDCNFDHLILQVPEQSVELYRNTPGWNRIRFITAYHEMSVGVSEIQCLDRGITYNTLARAEGAWTVAECPDWVKVTPSSGSDRRTEISISVASGSVGSEREGKVVFRLADKDYTTTVNIRQLACDTAEDTEISLHEASQSGREIPVLFIGEGFTAGQVADGTYMTAINDAYHHFFDIEPYKSYKDYFKASAAVAVSPDEGLERDNMSVSKFGFRDADGLEIDWNRVRSYAAAIGAEFNSREALVVVVPNYHAFVGMVNHSDEYADVALCGYSDDTYPYDFRGTVQHYAGGVAFGRLAPEYVTHYEFIRGCKCGSCNGLGEYMSGQAKGWYGNVSMNGAMNVVPWSHLVFDPRYSDIVDVYEGGYRHLRGVFRSENQSCMSTYIRYFNTISRELIVKRIMELSGHDFSFEEFAARDSREGCPN